MPLWVLCDLITTSIALMLGLSELNPHWSPSVEASLTVASSVIVIAIIKYYGDKWVIMLPLTAISSVFLIAVINNLFMILSKIL